MKKYRGKGVFSGIVIGKVSRIGGPETDDPEEMTACADPEPELRLYHAASDRAQSRLDALYQKALAESGEDVAQIFAIHRMMLTDPDFTQGIEDAIRAGSRAVPAVRQTARKMAAVLTDTGDDYLKNRAADVRDAAQGLIDAIREITVPDGTAPSEAETAVFTDRPDGQGLVICADDLTPSQTVGLDRNRVLAFVTAGGSANSHTAILARSRGIPAVVDVGEEFLSDLRDGQTVAVNGSDGEVIIDPEPALLLKLREKAAADRDHRARLESLKDVETRTADGRRVELYANIGGTADLPSALSCGAEGIGLMRSEFLFLGRLAPPDEEEQLTAYRKVVETMAGRRVVIRTLDIGADKQAGYLNLPAEDNPALGYRAIRICLDRTDLFRTQLRALYRASHYGRLAILFPMIASPWEVEEAIRICGQVRDELAAEKIPFSDAVELGIMIETPASAILADKLAPMVDFFSVGTNDLTQYTLACDRQNGRLDRYCDPHHEAILRLIGYAARCAHERGKWIGVCGELGADTTVTDKLLELGIDELSVSPASLLSVREAVLAHRAE